MVLERRRRSGLWRKVWASGILDGVDAVAKFKFRIGMGMHAVYVKPLDTKRINNQLQVIEYTNVSTSLGSESIEFEFV